MENQKFISCINYIRALKEENIPYAEFANALGLQVCTIQKRIKTGAIISKEEKDRLSEYFNLADMSPLCKNKIVKIDYYENEKLTNKVDDIFCQGVSVIYYENFFDLHASLMEETHISSAELLKNYLKEKRNDLTFSKNY